MPTPSTQFLETRLNWMSQLFLFATFLLVTHTSFGQAVSDIRVGFGYRTHFGGMQAYKDVKQFYNDNRTWLDKDLSAGGMMNGFEIGLEGNSEDFGFSFMHFYYVGSKSKAKGTNNGVEYKRMVRANMWGLETFDFHWSPIHLGETNIGFGVMPLGLGIMRVKTQLNDEDKVKPPLTYLESASNLSFVKSMHMYAQFHLDVTRVDIETIGALHIQFFYSIGPWQEYDLYYLNKEINPSTYPLHLKRTYQKINNFGLKLLINPN
jgi:hypothetical protein